MKFIRWLKQFFKTWIDWWLFIPLSLLLAIASYHFIPYVLKYFGIPEHEMQYTGTAWFYSLFKAATIFMFGIGVVFLSYRFFFPEMHRYLESSYWDSPHLSGTEHRTNIALLIPAVLFIGWCLICLAAFK